MGLLNQMKKNAINSSKQTIGFRIWNTTKSAILLYHLKKSATWTIPFTTTIGLRHSTVDSLLSLADQFTSIELISASLILDVKETVPIQLTVSEIVTDVLFRFKIYDVVMQDNGKTVRDELSTKTILMDDVLTNIPDTVSFSQFRTVNSISILAHKTPILNHLIKYMKNK